MSGAAHSPKCVLFNYFHLLQSDYVIERQPLTRTKFDALAPVARHGALTPSESPIHGAHRARGIASKQRRNLKKLTLDMKPVQRDYSVSNPPVEVEDGQSTEAQKGRR